MIHSSVRCQCYRRHPHCHSISRSLCLLSALHWVLPAWSSGRRSARPFSAQCCPRFARTRWVSAAQPAVFSHFTLQLVRFPNLSQHGGEAGGGLNEDQRSSPGLGASTVSRLAVRLPASAKIAGRLKRIRTGQLHDERSSLQNNKLPPNIFKSGHISAIFDFFGFVSLSNLCQAHRAASGAEIGSLSWKSNRKV